MGGDGAVPEVALLATGLAMVVHAGYHLSPSARRRGGRVWFFLGLLGVGTGGAT
jgi:hypothetical protein